MNLMNIGEAAAAAAVTPKMIRHYESLGLIPQADRTEAGYRLYGAREVAMLRFIRQSRALGFSMKQIESLLMLWRDDRRESRAVKALARQQLAELEERQHEIDQMKATLAELVAGCAGDHSSRCAILERLADVPLAVPRPVTATLKRVRPGSSARTSRARPAASAPRHTEPAHAALMAWAYSPRGG
jgi:Cu(I)-responsive transcriptional regulator